jgi:hypothetical protein
MAENTAPATIVGRNPITAAASRTRSNTGCLHEATATDAISGPKASENVAANPILVIV